MFGHEIVAYFKQNPDFESFFDGIFACPNLPKKLKDRHCFIFNNDDNVGRHWIAVANVDNVLEIMDSLGSNRDFIKKNIKIRGLKKFVCNDTQLQPDNSSHCALFCIFYLANRLLNPDVGFNDLLNIIFTENKEENEKICINFFEKGDFSEL
jgi:hypothetical protein